jgi:anti-sigma regulatory factor (Ser/Thr protein kinase)
VPSVRLFGELPLRASPEDHREWVVYEAILNAAFTHYPVWITCGYDRRVVEDERIDDARRTHPHRIGNVTAGSAEYADPAEVVRAFTPAPEPLHELIRMPLVPEPSAFRRRLASEASAGGVPPADVADLVVAAAEVLANAHRHGGGLRELRSGWIDDAFVLEIADHGTAFDDPLAGYLPPSPGIERGAGLWVARQLTRRLEVMPRPAGTTVRLWI